MQQLLHQNPNLEYIQLEMTFLMCIINRDCVKMCSLKMAGIGFIFGWGRCFFGECGHVLFKVQPAPMR